MPVAAQRSQVRRVTRMMVLMKGAHSVSARALPTGKTSTLRRSWRDRPMVVEAAVSVGTARAVMAWAASSRWA
jgi:hypothetical protein